MSYNYNDPYRGLQSARSTGQETVQVASRGLLIASTAILGDLLLLGTLLVHAGVFEL